MKKKKACLIIVIVILLAILFGFIYMYVQRKNAVAQIKKVVLNCTQNKRTASVQKAVLIISKTFQSNT